jgi:hypothetical protein
VQAVLLFCENRKFNKNLSKNSEELAQNAKKNSQVH